MSSNAILRSLIIICSLTVGGFLSAGTYKVPEENPIVTVQISDKWKTKEHEEFIETASPDGNSHVMVLPVEGNKVTEAAGEAMRHIRRQGNIVVKAESVKEEKARVKTKHVPMLSWSGTDHGQPIKIRCYVFSDTEGRRVVFMTRNLIAAEEKNRKDLTRILESVQTK